MKLSIVTTLCTVSLLILSGCVSPAPKPKEKVKIDTSLPVVTLTKHGIISDMKTIAFEWKSIQDPRVKSIYVYKQDLSDKNAKALTFYKGISNRFQTHFVDNTNQPDKKYKYAFKVASESAEGELSRVYTVSTLPVLQSVAWIHSIAGLPRMAKIIWRPHVNERVESYIIERKGYDEDEWSEIAKLDGRLNAEYIDKGLEDNHVYLYRVRVETFDGIISTPSAVVKTVTKALPSSITQISATKDLPKKITITWEKSQVKDFARYYLYRAQRSDGEYKLIAKLYNNIFTDKIEKDGENYFYRVGVVDKDGLESEHDKITAMGMTLAKPLAPTFFEAQYVGGVVRLTWKESDPRVKSYTVVRVAKEGWFKESVKKYKNIKKNSFVDRNIKPNTKYTYRVYGVDENGIVSNASLEAVISTPESDKIVDAPMSNEVEQSVKSESQTKQKASQTQEVISPVNDLDVNEN